MSSHERGGVSLSNPLGPYITFSASQLEVLPDPWAGSRGLLAAFWVSWSSCLIVVSMQ